MCFFKKKKKEVTETQNQVSAPEEAKVTAPKQPETKAEVKPATKPVAKTTAKSVSAKKPAASKKPATTSAKAKKPVANKTTTAKPATNNKEEKADSPKDYHIAQREDGKWQVKAAKAEKALKLFDTQAEAIEYAKKTAGNQEGSFTIHKKDGKIRKQSY